MDQTLFERRFREGAEQARDFARHYIAEALPDEMVFRVRLNASYDGKPLRPDQQVYPEDSSVEMARRLQRCTSSEVVEVLWRDGTVPEWVNLSVIGETGTATLIEVLSCGRFTAKEDRLYHQHEGRPPFHVLGPTLPVGYEKGDKFSIYNRAECWSLVDLAHLSNHRSKVWSLDLFGADFDDKSLAELPDFDALHILELRASPIRGPGLVFTQQLPELRYFRIYFNHDDGFNIDALPTCRGLRGLSLYLLPLGPWGYSGLAKQAPNLDTLIIESKYPVVLDARWPRAFDTLRVTAKSIEGSPIPTRVKSLSLHLSDADDDHIGQLLSGLKSVAHLGLRGTPVSDELVEPLLRRWPLEYIDVVNTRVSDDCVRRIAADYPELRMHPRLDIEV